jgi:hypothetical protein
MTEPIFLAIYDGPAGRLVVEYEPLPGGYVAIVSYELFPRPVTPFEQRQAERRKARRGLTLTEAEERAESLLPYTVREGLGLG